MDGGTAEAEGRALARRVALLLQAALLHRQSPPAVFAAFCDSRIARASDVFGLLGPAHELDSLIQRSLPVEA